MTDEQRAEVLKALGGMLDVLDACPWVASCACGWRSPELATEADAYAALWSHGTPCYAG